MTDEPLDSEMVGRLGRHFDRIEREPLPVSLSGEPSELVADRIASEERSGRAALIFSVAALVALALLVLSTVGGETGPENLDVVSGSSTTTSSSSPTSTDDRGSAEPTTTSEDPAGPTSTTTADDGGTTTSTADIEPTTTVPDPESTTTINTMSCPGAPGCSSTTLPISPTSADFPASTTTTTTTLVPGSLIDTDFSTTPVGQFPTGWTTDTGSWAVQQDGADRLLANTASSGESRASTGSANWTDVSAVAQLEVRTGGELVGVALRYQNANNYYFCKVDHAASQLYLGYVSGGVVTLMSQTGFSTTANTLYTMRFSADGSSLSCGIDTGPTLTGTRSQFSKGKVALAAKGDAAITRLVVDAL